jgi:hypothetical protein
MQCVAVLAAMLSESEMAFSLGNTRTDSVDMERGLPQGAPESPLVFVLITEMVLRPLLSRWRQRGSGWLLDAFWLAAVCYADDILVVSSSKTDLLSMFDELSDAFRSVGLDIGAEKTHWSSYPPEAGHTALFHDCAIEWEASLTFVGTVIDLGGGDGQAMDYRIAQATKVYGCWKPLLTCKWIPRLRRVALATKSVFLSALWMAETWNPTKAADSKFGSWGARILASIFGVRRQAEDTRGIFWRASHRLGHKLARRFGGGLQQRRREALHRWAGHLARTGQQPLSAALRTRCLAWWRFFQHPLFPLHGRRFGRPFRWEAQLVDFYGEAAGDSPETNNYGWMELAQNREAWRHGAERFAKHCG